MMTLLIFFIVLSIIVLVHEYGHFIAARKSGMKVYEFGLGFPPRALGIYKDPSSKKWVLVKGSGKNTLAETVGGEERKEEFPTTLYSLNWLPLGGFCKIKGESGEDAKDEDSFAAKSAGKRIIVLVAGVTMNLILAAVILAFGYMIGLPQAVSGENDSKAIFVEKPAVVIQQVLDNSPAEKAGLKMGDKILSLNNSEVKNSQEVLDLIGKNPSGTEIKVRINRENKEMELAATPEIINDSITPKLGISLVDAGIVRYPWYLAIWKGIQAAFIGLINVFIAFFLLIKNLILGKGLAFDVSGPVGIASMVGQSARMGLNYLINITAMISLSLAAINILPIPALDGGRVLFVLIEKVFRKPVPMKYEQVAHTIGFLLLMGLIVVVTVRDIIGLIR